MGNGPQIPDLSLVCAQNAAEGLGTLLHTEFLPTNIRKRQASELVRAKTKQNFQDIGSRRCSSVMRDA